MNNIIVLIRIGNSLTRNNITPGKDYSFRVNKNTKISELKRLFYECFDEDTKNDIMRYQLYTQKIIILHDDEGILLYAIVF